MFLKYGDYESCSTLKRCETERRMESVAFTVTFSFEQTGCPVLDRIRLNAFQRFSRKTSRRAVVYRRPPKHGNHRGRYYRRLNGG